MSLTILAQIITAAQKIQSSCAKLDKNMEAGRRAVAGKSPYSETSEVQQAIDALEGLDKQCKSIASNGIGDPDKDLDWSDLPRIIKQLEGTDAAREQAVRTFNNIVVSMSQFYDKADDLKDALAKIGAEAAKRAPVALQVRDLFLKCTENYPDIGTALKTTFLAASQSFEKAGAALGNLARSATAACSKIASDVKAGREKQQKLTKAMRDLQQARPEREGKPPATRQRVPAGRTVRV